MTPTNSSESGLNASSATGGIIQGSGTVEKHHFGSALITSLAIVFAGLFAIF